MSSKSEFKSFIISLLKRSRISVKNIDLLTSPENLTKFRTAFTHESFDSENNYESYEFSGDRVVNLCSATYIKKRFPETKSPKQLTRIHHFITSNKQYTPFVIDSGFEKHVRYGQEIQDIVNNTEDKYKDEEYLSILQDLFESFNGCLCEIIEEIYPVGTGVGVCYNIVSSFLDTVDIPTDDVSLMGPIAILKEIYDAKKWQFSTRGKDFVIIEKSEDNPEHKVIVYGYPLGDKTKILKNRIKLAEYSNINKNEAKNEAAKRAIKTLSSSYGIEYISRD